MRIFNKVCFVSLVSVFLSGCIIESTQLKGIFELFKEPSFNIQENAWLVRISDHESVVYAVSTADGILFSNKLGDQILFDGWVVRKVRGMGNIQLNIDIFDLGNTRTFMRGNRMLARHDCEGWEQQKSLKAVRYVQVCSDRNQYKNSILIRNSGDVSVIRQIVDERYTALTLSKLK